MVKSYLVVANCQGGGFARALRTLRPDAKVEVLSFANRRATGAIDETLARLGEYDVVFSQPTSRAVYGKLHNDVIAPMARKFVLFPALIFRGFHPDEVGLARMSGRLDSPTGGFHSLIAILSFIEGLSPERATRLYNKYVFSALGYFREYDRSLAFLRGQASRIGYDLPIEEWLAQGSFMHNSVHPKIFALASLALMACRMAGEEVEAGPIRNTAMRDALAWNSCFPVFPDIAEALGVQGSTDFLGFTRTNPDDPARTRPLEDFVAASHDIYRAAPDANFETPVIASARQALREAGLR